ncbi:hypothetical protein JNN96_37230 [Mycobacterium sp. DSM 3803]|nr:hypothetical protein [Mycobacterium sp. DSM 3803]
MHITAGQAIAAGDQLLAALRVADQPRSTMQLAAECGLPWRTIHIFDADCSWIRDFTTFRCGRVISCAGRVHTVAFPPPPGVIRPLMDNLAADGVVERVDASTVPAAVRSPGFGPQVTYAAVYWRYRGRRSDPRFDALVADLTESR